VSVDTRERCAQCAMTECECGFVPAWLGEIGDCNAAVLAERERVLKLIEAELLRHSVELPDDAGAPMERHCIRQVLKRIRKGEL
jgi:hypothetical protein